MNSLFISIFVKFRISYKEIIGLISIEQQQVN
jgi:hypothetical protein